MDNQNTQFDTLCQYITSIMWTIMVFPLIIILIATLSFFSGHCFISCFISDMAVEVGFDLVVYFATWVFANVALLVSSLFWFELSFGNKVDESDNKVARDYKNLALFLVTGEVLIVVFQFIGIILVMESAQLHWVAGCITGSIVVALALIVVWSIRRIPIMDNKS